MSRNLNLIAGHCGPLLAERSLPVGSLGRLDPILVRNLHKHAFGSEFFQLARHAVAEGAGADRHVVHEEVGQRVGVGSNPEVYAFLAW